ncbi:MAG: hypothetical protein ABI639_16600 [Thermoanaerobaculia bacterium]
MRLMLLAFVSGVVLGALELVLHLSPEAFGQRRSNEIFSRYDTRPGGIYAREKSSRMRFMWPDYTTENYWNGYRWRHSTDALGFRNPPGTPAGVLLLGDSLIYGHGVEEEETVAHFLRVEHEVPAYNMGRQGAALYDEYVYLRTFLPELTPSAIVLFVFLNDFDDLEVYRTTEEIVQIPEIDRLDYTAIRTWTKQLPGKIPSLPRQWLWRRPSLRLLASAVRELRGLTWTAPAWAAPPGIDPPFLAPLVDPDRLARLQSYYDRIFADLAKRCSDRSQALRIVFLPAVLGPGVGVEAQANALALVRTAAAEAELPVYDSSAQFSGCTACYLPNDGHFTAEGHRRLARYLAETVLRRN